MEVLPWMLFLVHFISFAMGTCSWSLSEVRVLPIRSLTVQDYPLGITDDTTPQTFYIRAYLTYSDCPFTMTAEATAAVDFSTYTALPTNFSFDPLFQSTHFAYLFPNLTLNTLDASAQITIVMASC